MDRASCYNMTEMTKWSNDGGISVKGVYGLGSGTSKGAFYKFYPSKELLFFEILEDMHTEIYEASTGVLKQN